MDFSDIRRVFRIGSVRPDPERDLDEELEFHFQRAIEDLIRQGMKQPEAREEAQRRFGDLKRYRRQLEDIDRVQVARARRAEMMFVFWQSVSYTLRGLRRSPGFTAGVVLTLALGIGANATMFGVVDRLLLSPPPHVQDPDRVRRLFVARDNMFSGEEYVSSTIAQPDYIDWESARSFESTAAYFLTRLTLGRGEDAARVRATLATPSFFPLLGVKPILGRFFDETEDVRDAPGVAVISYGFWRRQFGGDPSVLGRTLEIDDGSFTVIGVAPRRFTGVDLAPQDVWLPLRASAPRIGMGRWWYEGSRTSYWLKSIVRLAPGTSVETAETEATQLHRAGRRELIEEGRYAPDVRVIAAPVIAARGPGASDESVVSRWLAGVSLIVLLIACANVANLLLARGARRRREIAIRLAMGVSRGRLVGQLLVESMMLALLGGVAAVAVATWGASLMRSVLLPNVAWLDSPTNVRVLAFTGAAILLTGLLTGLVPALQVSHPDVAGSLKSGVREGSGRRSRTRAVLLIAQAALSVVLLSGAGLFVRSLHRVSSLDMGFEAERVLVAMLELEPGERSRDDLLNIYERSAERLRGLPSVERSSISTSIPFLSSAGARISVPGRDSIPTPKTGGPYFHAVTPDHFATLGMKITRGRGFGPGDVKGGAPVVVVEEALARGVWPGEDPIGKCLIIDDHVREGVNSPYQPRADAREEPAATTDGCTEVIGVVATSRRQEVIEGEGWQYFLPIRQRMLDGLPQGLFIRTAGESDPMAPAIRRELQAAIPEVRFAVVLSLQNLIDRQLRAWTLGATMFSVFGALALLVAGVGLYSVLSFGVTQRQHEIGVRSALGATRDRIVALVLKEALALAAVGILLGLAVVYAAGRAVAPLLYEVSPRDPAVLSLVTLMILIIASLAGSLPAWRAARVHPNVALRVE